MWMNSDRLLNHNSVINSVRQYSQESCEEKPLLSLWLFINYADCEKAQWKHYQAVL